MLPPLVLTRAAVRFLKLLAGLSLLLLSPLAADAAADGRALFQQHCAICHGGEGQGQGAIFPPLARSDFLVQERDRALKGPMEGLSGKIVVNGQTYDGVMPPTVIDDEQLAAVFSYILTSWGNNGSAIATEEIARLRATSKVPTFAQLQAPAGGEALPAAPAGWQLSVGAELSFSPTRLAAHPDGEHVLALSATGDIWSWKPGTAEVTRLFTGVSYIGPKRGETTVMGLTVDARGRLYVTCNECLLTTDPVSDAITIFRTEPWTRERPWSTPSAWFKTSNPYGIGPYNHGVSHIAQGPDGWLYVNSGARTDGGETGKDPHYATTGETPTTAAMWRLNPEAATPAMEVWARGLRNTYGFCWDAEGHLIGTENGPDAHAPEELNWIEAGRHYGFPFAFSDWSAKPYPYTPDRPAGLEITLPLRNLGPDGGGNAQGLSTFNPHSSPAGIVWLDRDWPAPLGGSFLVARFGNLLKLDQDVGFDVLQIHADLIARTIRANQLLCPLGRPIDLLKLSGHRLVIAEYTRSFSLAGGLGRPGRLLLLQPK